MKTNNHSEKKWQLLIAALADGVIVIHQDGTILYVNEPAANLFGRSSKELIGQNFMYPLASNELQEIDIIKPNGQVLTVEMNVKEGAWADQSAWILSLRDVTEKKHKIEQLEIASHVFKHAHEGIMVTDVNSILVEVNQSFLDMTGYTRTELIGKNPKVIKSDQHNEQFYELMHKSIKDFGYWKGEIWGKHKNGNFFPVFLTVTAVKNMDNQVINYIGFCYDMELLKKQEDLIKHMKLFDPLTNLPNQYNLSDTLADLMTKTREGDLNLIIAYISIDGIHSEQNRKILTDKDKDLLIVLIADRLSHVLKKDIFLARISHSDFVAIFKTTNTILTVNPIIQKLSIELALPYEVCAKTVSLSSNIGVTSYPQDLILYPEELIRQSHLAAYEAKYANENQYKLFDRPMELQKIKQTHQINEIKNAITRNQLLVFYQPKINMQTGEIIGAEALLRFQHPQRGLLSPAQFLPNTTNHSIFIDIGEWVLEHVLQQLEQWEHLKMSIPISINISPYHLQQENFLSRLFEIMAKHPKVSSHLIELEILETELVQNSAHVKKIIQECKKRGVLFALDDFGTGYSSLTYLKELPASWIKLDQTFVRDSVSKPENISILEACIQMCKLLNRKVIAEGVETIQHGKLLLYLGCVNAQGYAISRPISAENFRQWIDQWISSSEWTIDAAKLKEGRQLIKSIIEYHSKMDMIKQSLVTGEVISSNLLLKNTALVRWIEREKKSVRNSIADIERIDQLISLQKDLGYEIEQILRFPRFDFKKLALNHMEQLEIISSELLNQLLLLI